MNLDEFCLADSLPSFFYGGEKADLNVWTKTVESVADVPEGRKTVRLFTSPDGLLALRITMLEYADFPAVKYWPELIGCGRERSKIVSAFRSFELNLSGLPWAETVVRATCGSKADPADFSARKIVLSEFPQQDLLDISSSEGRSSANWMPYFGLDLSETEGLELAVGWSGAWDLKISRGAGDDFMAKLGKVMRSSFELHCSFGMKNFRSYLNAGETLRQPSVLVLKRSGVSVNDFRTVIHDFMVAHNAPRNGRGELLKPIFPVTVSGGNRRPEDTLKIVDYVVRAKLPVDTVWMDAGWYGAAHIPNTGVPCGDCWEKYVGDWRVNTGIHPTGTLRPLSDAAHAAGKRFLLWFEPERLNGIAPILQEHPEFARKCKGAAEDRYLLRIDHEPAYQWIFSTLCRIIDENQVDIYRQDFNMDPYPVWAEFEEPDRAGVNEVKHITALYRLWDDLKKRYPDMLIDNCASGGKRLDFELMSRSHVYCRSDLLIARGEPQLHRYQHLLGENALLNLLDWIPFQGGEGNSAETFDDYEFFSLIGTGIVFTPPDWEGGCIRRDFTDEETAWFQKVFSVADRIRRILAGKFYPLTERADLSENVWTAYEGFDPESGRGVAVFFRRKTAVPTMTFELKGIEPDAQYEVEDASTGAKQTLYGEELAHQTISFSTAPDGKVLFFRKIAMPSHIQRLGLPVLSGDPAQHLSTLLKNYVASCGKALVTVVSCPEIPDEKFAAYLDSLRVVLKRDGKTPNYIWLYEPDRKRYRIVLLTNVRIAQFPDEIPATLSRLWLDLTGLPLYLQDQLTADPGNVQKIAAELSGEALSGSCKPKSGMWQY